MNLPSKSSCKKSGRIGGLVRARVHLISGEYLTGREIAQRVGLRPSTVSSKIAEHNGPLTWEVFR